jgi:hypothetical protein
MELRRVNEFRIKITRNFVLFTACIILLGWLNEGGYVTAVEYKTVMLDLFEVSVSHSRVGEDEPSGLLRHVD